MSFSAARGRCNQHWSGSGGCACHELLLFHLSLITLILYISPLKILAVSRLSCVLWSCGALVLLTSVLSVPPGHIERRTAARCLAPLLDGYSCASAGVLVSDQRVGSTSALPTVSDYPETCSSCSTSCILCRVIVTVWFLLHWRINQLFTSILCIWVLCSPHPVTESTEHIMDTAEEDEMRRALM